MPVFIVTLQISAIEAESKAVAVSESDLVPLSRALRETSENPLLALIQTYLGPAILVLQQNINDNLDRLTDLVNQLKNSELYNLISIVLATLNISLDNVTSLIEELQADVNEILAFFTGNDLSNA